MDEKDLILVTLIINKVRMLQLLVEDIDDVPDGVSYEMNEKYIYKIHVNNCKEYQINQTTCSETVVKTIVPAVYTKFTRHCSYLIRTIWIISCSGICFGGTCGGSQLS